MSKQDYLIILKEAKSKLPTATTQQKIRILEKLLILKNKLVENKDTEPLINESADFLPEK